MGDAQGAAGKTSGTHESRLVLTLDRHEFTMTIGGSVNNYDEALAMLELAQREIKTQLRARRSALAGPMVPKLSRLFVHVRNEA